MDHRTWPEIPAALIDHLDKLIPEKSPRPGVSHDELMFQGGQRELVRTLRAVFNLQNETVLNVSSTESEFYAPADDG